jgi:transcription elongation factor Elf1
MTNHYSDERRRKILSFLRCPYCGEQNMPNQKEMIEIDGRGKGYCNKCGATFDVDEQKP